MDDEQRKHLEEKRKNRPKGFLSGLNPESLKKALEFYGIRYRYNTRRYHVQLCKKGDTWESINDITREDLRYRIASDFERQDGRSPNDSKKRLPAVWSDRDFKSCFNALAGEGILDGNPKCHVDSFVEYLKNCADRYPDDGINFVDNWIGEIYEVEPMDPLLFTWACRSVLLGAVSRAIKPGEKHDTAVILIDKKQGKGKSSMWRNLFPEQFQSEWFSDSVNLHDRHKERLEGCTGKVIVELGELSGLRRAEIEEVKRFLAAQHDSIRLPYRSDPEDIERRFILVGTSNSVFCLPNDPTGNRRWIPVAIRGGNAARMRSWLSENRDRLWAEVWRRRHEQAWVPDEVTEILEKHNEGFQYRDEAAELAVEDFLKNNGDREFKTTDIRSWDGDLGRLSKAIENTKEWQYKTLRNPRRRRWVRIAGKGEPIPQHIPHMDEPIKF